MHAYFGKLNAIQMTVDNTTDINSAAILTINRNRSISCKLSTHAFGMIVTIKRPW